MKVGTLEMETFSMAHLAGHSASPKEHGEYSIRNKINQMQKLCARAH